MIKEDSVPAYRQTVVPKTVFVHLPNTDPMSVMHLGMTWESPEIVPSL